MNKFSFIFIVAMFMSVLGWSQTHNVTFIVTSPDSTPVYVFGSWSGWANWPGNPMTSIGNNQYSATVALADNTTFEYLFVNGTAAFAKEALSPTAACTNGNTQYTNRVLVQGATDTTLCYTWATCTTCTPPAANVPMTFTVESPDSTPVFVFGSWSGWGNYPGEPMTSIGNNKYSATVMLPPNATYEYLYVNGASTYAKEILNPAWTCTNGNGQYTNRVLQLGATADSICSQWATCNTCGSVVPSNINVTFNLQNAPSSSMYVFGSWSGWSNWPGNKMTETPAGSGVYSVTIPMGSVQAIEYLFVNGTDTTKETLDSTWACTNHNPVYTNRLTTLGSADTTLCSRWASCDVCWVASVNNPKNSDLKLQYNQNSIRFNSSENITIDQLNIYDITGRKVYSADKGLNTNMSIPVNLNLNTVYIFSIKAGDYTQTFRGVVF